MKRLLLAVLLLAVVFPSAAAAQTTQVTVTRFDDPNAGHAAIADDCSLREAMDRFDDDLEIVLPSATQDYVLDSGLAIGRGSTRTITGPAGGLATIRLAASAPDSYVVSIGTSTPVTTLRNVRITGGRGDDSGGGIEVNGVGTLNVFDSEIVGNRAESGGGIWSAGTVNLERTTVAGNVATGNGSTDPGRGGGLFVEGSATLTNSTVSGNTAATGGGVYTSGPLTLQNATVAANTGGGLHDLQGESVMRSTLLADNEGGECSGQPGGGAEEYNLAADATCGLDGPGDRVAAALLAPLAANGGLTRTHALYTGSPAIDAVPAGCLATDQRLVARTSPCDIGAFEGSIAGGPPPPPPPGDDLPPPVAGKTVNAVPVRGTVRIKLPGRKRFRVAGRGRADPGRHDRRHAQGPRDDHRGRWPDGDVLRRHLQDRADQGLHATHDAAADREAELRRARQGERGGEAQEEAPAVGRRQRQVPDRGQLQLGDGARHEVAGRGPLHEHAHARDRGPRGGAGLRQAQDRDRARGQAVRGQGQALA